MVVWNGAVGRERDDRFKRDSGELIGPAVGCGGEGEGGVQDNFQLSSLNKWVDGVGRMSGGHWRQSRCRQAELGTWVWT